MSRTDHWNEVYSRRAADEVSWYEPEATTSLALLDAAGLGPSSRVIDVGGGASRLVDALVARGCRDVTVLDLSDRALGHARDRLGGRASLVRWIAGDALSFAADAPFDVWHDRAAFHFLTDPADRARYREGLAASTNQGAHAIVGTFAEDGPERCSGLPVARYSADALAQELGPAWRLVEARRHVHRTPAGREQPFTFALFTRR